MNSPDPLAAPEDGGAPSGYRLGNFELQAVVALHANGVVYRAWDHNLGIPVAIKEYLPQRLAWRKPDGDIEPLDADTIDSFERGRHAFVDEARLLARCDHPNLLRVRQLLQAHGTAYRVMPWYSGRSLLDVRREMSNPPDEPALRALLSELLGALEAYHRVGGVHGSVNPVRIMLLDDDRALLLGPRAARRATAIDAVESLMRQLEPSFVAPEQLSPSDRTPLGPWTDFYALARVVRFCVSGMLPAPPGSPAAEALAVTVNKLYFDRPGVEYSAPFLAALDAAAAPEIERRPQTVAEFCQWLDEGPRRHGAGAPERAPIPPHGLRETLPEIEGSWGITAPGPALAAGHVPVPAPPISVPVPVPVPPPGPAPAAGRSPGAEAMPSPTSPPRPRDEEVPDAETIALIQRVIESIPSPATPLIEPIRPEPAWQTDRDFELPIAPPPRRGVHPAWFVLALPLLAFIAYAAWELLQPSLRTAPPGLVTVAPPAPAPPPASAPPTVAGTQAPGRLPVEAPAAPAPATGQAPVDATASAGPSSEAPQAAATPTPETSTSGLASTRGAANVPAPTIPAPPRSAPAAPPRSTAGTPREVCGERTHFSLYRCMEQQCAAAAWAGHPQCVRFKATDRVD